MGCTLFFFRINRSVKFLVVFFFLSVFFLVGLGTAVAVGKNCLDIVPV